MVYLALNYFFSLSFIYNCTYHSFLKIASLLDEFVLYYIGQTDPDSSHAISTIIKNSVNFTQSATCCKRWIDQILGILALVTFSITSYFLGPTGSKLVATLDSAFVIIADIAYFIFLYNNRIYMYSHHVDSGVMTNLIGIIMIIYRGCLAVSANYWVLGHSVGYMAIEVFLINSIVNFW